MIEKSLYERHFIGLIEDNEGTLKFGPRSIVKIIDILANNFPVGDKITLKIKQKSIKADENKQFEGNDSPEDKKKTRTHIYMPSTLHIWGESRRQTPSPYMGGGLQQEKAHKQL